jgi:hypothetical protein
MIVTSCCIWSVAIMDAVGRSCRLSTIRIPSQYRFLNGGIDFSANSKHCQERLDSGVIVSELV